MTRTRTRLALVAGALSLGLAGAFLLSPTASAATRPDLRTTIAAPSSRCSSCSGLGTPSRAHAVTR